MISKALFAGLSKKLDGDLKTDNLHKAIYATDASVYRKTPLAVAYPKHVDDIKQLIFFANIHNISLIPRAAGTSLAGQCVGDGIIVDTSRYFTRIFNLNEEEKIIEVEPGVIRDELNLFLKPYGLFFGPNTSTSNRCTIGGMVGNNSSGTTSIKFGVTRDKILESTVVLSNGEVVTFGELGKPLLLKKMESSNLEGDIYKKVYNVLISEEIQQQINDHFPKKEIHRRNTGYALDAMVEMEPFKNTGKLFNLNKLLCGSEGTLAITTKIKLQLDELPPENKLMVIAHFDSIRKCCDIVKSVMKHDLFGCEMLDKTILDCTKSNKTQLPNRFFIQGDPKAILMLELANDNDTVLNSQLEALLKTIKSSKQSYAYPILKGEEIHKAMELRKAGLGLLGNMIGDRKAVACIEDTAVSLDDLSDYIDEFGNLMEQYKQEAVYYAHAGAGELHLRPILNLKEKEDVALFRKITTEVAALVKKYGGSFSGEHGDGIVRAEFIEMMIGKDNYQVLREIKNAFDPRNIFNRGKIIDSFPMDASLRYEPGRREPEIKTLLDFSDSLGILRATEKCNGSGDCRKTELTAGAMCPSYHATRNESDTTRARANALREFLTHSSKENKFDHKELKEVFELCLSCKACASECPSNVDIAALKAEFLYQYQKINGLSLRDKVFAHYGQLNALASKYPVLSNFLLRSYISGRFIKYALGIHPKRSLPEVSSFNFESLIIDKNNKPQQRVILYIDEFTRYNDHEIGADAILLLQKLNYQVVLFYANSGRALISKGLLEEAKELAKKNIKELKIILRDKDVILGLEPSAILSFRDEYLKLTDLSNTANYIAKRSFLVEEFIAAEIEKKHILSSHFTDSSKTITIHCHCHQKSLSRQSYTLKMLSLPVNYNAILINSGCCGMAGSFGFEKRHYDISMKIAELKLFPAIKEIDNNTIIAANGTSCRHQILDGTKQKALHPVTILKEALKT